MDVTFFLLRLLRLQLHNGLMIFVVVEAEVEIIVVGMMGMIGVIVVGVILQGLHPKEI
jgi:hypothetical protein